MLVLSLATMSQSQLPKSPEWSQFSIWDFQKIFLVRIQTQWTFSHWFLSQAAKGFLWHSSYQNSALKQLLISLSFHNQPIFKLWWVQRVVWKPKSHCALPVPSGLSHDLQTDSLTFGPRGLVWENTHFVEVWQWYSFYIPNAGQE